MKIIPSVLQDHFNETVNTTCYLLRIIRNVGFNGEPAPVIGVCSLDLPVIYDDGQGAIVYSAMAGFLPSNTASSSDLSIDNAEADILIPAYDLGPIIESEIIRGLYDNAPYILYRINYKDLTPGRHEIVMAGTIGQTKVINGLSCFAELRPITQKLKQNLCELDSITCRATFGDAKCGIDAEALFINGEVTQQGLEADRVFESDDLAVSSGFDEQYRPGMIEWLTGNNIGLSNEVESNDNGIVTLTFHARYDIEIGDTFRIRPDCAKQYIQNCIGQHNNGLNFRGEPFIPVGDESSMQVPGATQANVGLPEFAGAE